MQLVDVPEVLRANPAPSGGRVDVRHEDAGVHDVSADLTGQGRETVTLTRRCADCRRPGKSSSPRQQAAFRELEVVPDESRRRALFGEMARRAGDVRGEPGLNERTGDVEHDRLA